MSKVVITFSKEEIVKDVAEAYNRIPGELDIDACSMCIVNDQLQFTLTRNRITAQQDSGSGLQADDYRMRELQRQKEAAYANQSLQRTTSGI